MKAKKEIKQIKSCVWGNIENSIYLQTQMRIYNLIKRKVDIEIMESAVIQTDYDVVSVSVEDGTREFVDCLITS
jgi:hypothetical protein